MFKLLIASFCLSACVPDGASNSEIWYSTEAEEDFSYLPLGDIPYTLSTESWTHEKGEVAVDLYLPDGTESPVALFLPGAFVVKERYEWVGHALASHGVAAVIVQPPEDFARSYSTTGTLAWLESSELGDSLDLGKLLLMGHSAGALTQAGLTDPSACNPGFCDDAAATPSGLAGMALFGFHNEGESDSPMAAVEVPWLLVSGSQDTLATPSEVEATFERLQDRPVSWVEVQGMNHYQFTGYVDPDEDRLLEKDGLPEVSDREARYTAATYLVRFAQSVLTDPTQSWDPGLLSEGDSSVLVEAREAFYPPHNSAELPRVMTEPVAEPGLDGQEDQVGVVATASFQGETWMLVRDDAHGASVWTWNGSEASLQQADWGNPHLNAIFGSAVEFQGELFVGLSSGFPGAGHKSAGSEIWATDGEGWRPVMGPQVDEDSLYTVQDCSLLSDGSAELTFKESLDSSLLENAFLDTDDHADRMPLFFDIESWDNQRITVSQETNAAIEAEEVPCDEIFERGTLALRTGNDEAGFGLAWNKSITEMTVHNGRLYVATGLNYVYGPELWMSEDGHSFSQVIGSELWGTGEDGLPLTTSITALLSWQDQLLVGTTGRTGYGARLLSLDPEGHPTWLVDNSVDTDEVGLDEAGFGTGALQVADLTIFQDRIWLSTLNLSGLEVFTTSDPAEKWDTVVGANGTFAPGFGLEDQFAAKMWVVDEELWLGSYVYAVMSSDLDEMSASAWRSRDGESWQMVSAHAFGVNAPTLSSVFLEDGNLFGAAGFGGLANATNFGPLRLFSLTEVSH